MPVVCKSLKALSLIIEAWSSSILQIARKQRCDGDLFSISEIVLCKHLTHHREVPLLSDFLILAINSCFELQNGNIMLTSTSNAQ